MSTETLTTATPKRFRLYFQWSRLSIALLYFAVGALYGVFSHSHYRGLVILCYTAAGIVWLTNAIGVWWEFRIDGIFERRQWRTRMVPYDAITVVGHWEDVPDAIDIRFESPDPKIFPQGSMPVLVSDRTGFLDTLRNLAPHADFRL